ncbi:hypothetical protein GobsT_66200 [Gemmata obscuriglobus]|uniref:GspE/PulE/PilB domain-containing protein n=1 Tax=Gemmata obscuriglobus TaxID=114 RepID=UPI00016C4DA5|nr:type IV fimbrial assembly protein PilB [Gemmata obscuriglobus]QEG31776.1 hypothetical protein GobsT_66200 [Gemmata obscuriglobus]VTS11121.1 type ii secretion system protein e : Type IV fimbrial assembly protein PilB OS=Planctomyces maris DSM 8797 GN=PM8797T_13468 PE=4 SV=1: T2SE_Nter [Gemmata obscuriglobus UQM 2246]
MPARSPPLAVVQLIPESVARAHTVLAVRLDGRTVHVATAYPSDVLLRDKLSFLLNKYIAFAQYPRDEIRDAIDRLYGRTETESVEPAHRAGDRGGHRDRPDAQAPGGGAGGACRTDERQRAHLGRLKELGVDLTALLTQGRADRVIELRGGQGVSPHLHLDGTDADA